MAAASTDGRTIAASQANSFAEAHLGAANLGHKARNACLLRVAKQVCRHPGGTLPNKLAHPADYDAMDRLMNRPQTTHSSVLEAHLQRTKDIMTGSSRPC